MEDDIHAVKSMLLQLVPTGALDIILNGYAKLASAQLSNDPMPKLGIENMQDKDRASDFYQSAEWAEIEGLLVEYRALCILATYCNPGIPRDVKLENIQFNFSLMLYYLEERAKSSREPDLTGS